MCCLYAVQYPEHLLLQTMKILLATTKEYSIGI